MRSAGVVAVAFVAGDFFAVIFIYKQVGSFVDADAMEFGGLPRVDLHWSEREIESLTEHLLGQQARPTEALIQLMRG